MVASEDAGLLESGRFIKFPRTNETTFPPGMDAINEVIIGYTISKKEVGLWMFKRFIEEEVREDWVNRKTGVMVSY